MIDRLEDAAPRPDAAPLPDAAMDWKEEDV
jgi:hypothetical protein